MEFEHEHEYGAMSRDYADRESWRLTPEHWRCEKEMAHACVRNEQDMHCTYNVTLRCVRVTIVGVIQQCVLNVVRMCL
jgi:hypothetical protein